MSTQLKIHSIMLYKLRNEAHFGLMRFIVDLFGSVPEIILTTVAPVLQAFQAGVEEEDRALELIRSSGYTPQLVVLDRFRLGLHNAVRTVVNAFLHSPVTQALNAATELKTVLDRYASLVKVTRYERTQLIFNLLQDLKIAQTDLNQLALNFLVSQLKVSNNRFYEITGQRADEEAEKALMAKMATVRAQLDALYSQMTALIQAAMIINGTADFEHFVARLNVRIDEARRTIHRAKSSDTGNDGIDGGDLTEEEPDGENGE
ncbi:MAG: DUF6261 family protein [Tannerella sp.]|jgi:hypothetical protein|nr:DUF6261 family protein [Tannerella sp.]